MDTFKMTQALFEAFCTHQSLIDTLFSGSQAAVLPSNIEQGIKEYVFRTTPGACNDKALNVLLSYQIYGSYYAYWNNYKQFGNNQVLDILDAITVHTQKAVTEKI